MRKILIIIIVNIFIINFVFPQGAAINSNNAPADSSAMLDVSSDNQGMLIPRMSTAKRPANPVESLLIYNTDTQCFEAYNAATSQWKSIWCLGSGFTCGSPFTDTRNNKTYNTIMIGNQCWFKENLNATKYFNSETIPEVTDNTAWSTLSTGAYCYYNNDVNNAATYGLLYNWYAATDSRKICPAGWHLPSSAEWTTLITFLGGTSVAGGKLKEAGTVHWTTPNTGATNSSNFTALPGGTRGTTPASFDYLGKNSYFISSTEIDATYGYYCNLLNTSQSAQIYSNIKKYGYSVRCLKD